MKTLLILLAFCIVVPCKLATSQTVKDGQDRGASDRQILFQKNHSETDKYVIDPCNIDPDLPRCKGDNKNDQR